MDSKVKFSEIMRHRQTLSFEVYPPKTEKGMAKLPGTLEKLVSLHPDYISCTYGAGGSNVGRNQEVLQMVRKLTVPVTHLTCVGQTRAQIVKLLDRYIDLGVTHILALRGDIPYGQSGVNGDFEHASDLVAFIRKEYGSTFEIAVAGTPGGHVESRSLTEDISHLREKQEAGADYIITQLCFDMDIFRDWHERIRRAGITIPVDAGIMPVTSKKSVLTQCFSHNACPVPRDLALVLTHNWFDTDPEGQEVPGVKEAFRREGIDYTVGLLHQYMAEGVEGIHLYTMDKYEDVAEIIKRSGLRSFINDYPKPF